MAKPRITVNQKGLEKLLRSEAVKADLKTRAERIRAGAESDARGARGYVVVESNLREDRAGVAVFANGHALHAERKRHHLIRNLGKGGD